MAKTLTRLLSTAVEISKPKLSLPDPGSHPTIRLISYTIHKRHNHQQTPDNQQGSASVSQTEASKPENETQPDPDEHGEDEDEDGDRGYEFVNKQTGEVGGPRGPEPTRYGDWEKGGRCCDF